MTKIPVISVDDGVPVPAMSVEGLPLADLKVGESILFPLEFRSKVAIQATRLKNNSDMEFTVRKENGSKCRIWRIK